MIQPGGWRRAFARLETGISVVVLGAMAALPLIEILARRLLGVGVPGSILIVQNLTLVLAFLGAALAAREERLLALSTASFVSSRLRSELRIATHALGAGVAAWLVLAGVDFTRAEKEAGNVLVLGVPTWAVVAVIPVAMALLAGRLVARASTSWRARAVAAAGLLLPLLISVAPVLGGPYLVVPGLAIMIVAALLGLPIFAALGGIALLLFRAEGVPIATVPVAAYQLTSFPILPAVPLFTLSGFILAAGKSSDRLVRAFTALVGWMPGGTAVVTTIVFVFFTSFTGASGVTILTLGGLLLPVLIKSRYPESFSLGLVTVSGSIGLLLPPSLPVILYAVNSRQAVDDLLLAGILPGALFVVLIALWGVRQGMLAGSTRAPFIAKEAWAAAWGAKWELLLPGVVLLAIFGGFATMVEAAALTVLYALGIQCLIHRDVSIRRDLPRVLADCASLVGGFLIILAVALALTDYMNYAEIPARALELVRQNIASPTLFLLILNLFLIVVGATMDIYSAIFVIVPLVAPMAAAYGIHPVHLGIVFLANLELGYLTPPMGENLFLSAFRFDRPVMRIFRYSLPFYLILAAGVLMITYLPFLTVGFLRLLGR